MCVKHKYSLFNNNTHNPCVQNNEKVKEVVAKTRSHPRKRLQYIYDLAKSKSVCEGGDVMEKKFDPLSDLPQDPGQSVSPVSLLHALLLFSNIPYLCT